MDILHICPANVATGGTDSIHRLVRELNRCGANAKILYVNGDLRSPMPEPYKKYGCDYLVDVPSDFEGLIIFPEIWANKILEPQFEKYQVAINWQGVDVYRWNNPQTEWYKFLKRKDAIHFTNMQYGMEFLKGLGLQPSKVSDCVDDIFFEEFNDNYVRNDVVLYNPVYVKLTRFQQTVMARCFTERGIKFLPIEGYPQEQLLSLFRLSKLYIDFGEFSGRERLPRETVTQGCCVLTSKLGAANYFEDISIPDKYKLDDVDQAIAMIRYILANYELCKPDFDQYRQSLVQDRLNYPNEVKALYEILNSNSSL